MDVKRLIKQFLSYVLVGGSAAIVEWLFFGVCTYFIHLNYLISTIIAFLTATFVNWALGRKLTFKEDSKKLSPAAELLQVYLASAIGLGLNLLLMFLFVQIFNWNEMISKIIATGLVFIWNFASRRFVIYRDRNK